MPVATVCESPVVTTVPVMLGTVTVLFEPDAFVNANLVW